jgi:hypothetical protein
MLTEHHQRLLTTAVDGTLTPAQSRQLAQLLADSEAARDLLAQLRADAERLRRLPRRAAPVDLTPAVLTAIQDRQLTPAPRTPATTRRASAHWRYAPLAIAASICLAITLGTAGLLSLDQPDRAMHSHNRRPQSRSSNSLPATPTTPRPTTPTEAPNLVEQPQPEVPVVKSEPTEPAESPDPSERPKPQPADHLTSPINKLPAEAFEVVKLRLPTIGLVRQLDEAQFKTKVEAEIRGSEAIRLELFTRNPLRATERLQVLLRNQGIKLIVEPLAQDALKKKLAGEYAVLTEHLTQADLLKLCHQLAADERHAERTGKASEAGWEDFVLRGLTPADLRELARTLGVEPSRLRSAPPTDPNQAIADSTITQLVDKLTNPTPAEPKQTKSPPERLALVYTPLPTLRPILLTGPYFEGRGPRRPDTLLVSIVVRRLL